MPKAPRLAPYLARPARNDPVAVGMPGAIAQHYLYAYPYPSWHPAATHCNTGMLSPPTSVAAPSRRSDAREFDTWVPSPPPPPPPPPRPPHALVFRTPAAATRVAHAHARADACSPYARPGPRAATTTTPASSTPPTPREFWTVPRPAPAGPREFWTSPACVDAGLPPTPPTPTSPALTVPAADCAPPRIAVDELRATSGVWPVPTRACAVAERGAARPLVPLVPVVPVRQRQRQRYTSIGGMRDRHAGSQAHAAAA
ncbi:hypothetical protein AMAG_19472 [Allomyces macrogynus ATCC 38327]|uniref:Uncharacterized protein n=1 Tax=Allomyces macrogynus (strain ATCC 38327) TaxID=578462 RepID=A0A0L0SSX8_ALLM3|nr:hypothetical protein AMAG_19472 [Allomyces macrogynus ATCC 38327]|eukprot:KNE65465.1 hypothetical protein AMAG_19472 [Allomyces macrogynus ATCC 38327]